MSEIKPWDETWNCWMAGETMLVSITNADGGDVIIASTRDPNMRNRLRFASNAPELYRSLAAMCALFAEDIDEGFPLPKEYETARVLLRKTRGE